VPFIEGAHLFLALRLHLRVALDFPQQSRFLGRRLLTHPDLARCRGDAEAIELAGIHWATEQCRDLLDKDIAGIHLYTLNKSDATKRIARTLGVRPVGGAK